MNIIESPYSSCQCKSLNLHVTGSLPSSGLPPYIFTVKSMPMATRSTVWEIMDHCSVLCCAGAYPSAWGSVPTSTPWKSKPLTYCNGQCAAVEYPQYLSLVI